MEVARRQKNVIWTFSIGLPIGIALAFFQHSEKFFPDCLRFAAFVTAITLLYFISKLAAALRKSEFLYIFASLVPFVGMFALMDLIIKAGNMLRDKGIKVGPMRARMSDFEKIQQDGSCEAAQKSP